MGDQRPKLFGVVFDLNQSPLPSPRETVADDGDDDDAVVVVEPPRLSLPRRNQALPVAVTAGAGVGAGAGAGHGQGQSCREADGESMLCIDCRSESSSKGPRSGEGIKQWRCFKCLLKARGGDRAENSNGASGGGGRGGGGGIALLDINASPPEDMEVDDAAPADVARGNHGVKYEFLLIYLPLYFYVKFSSCLIEWVLYFVIQLIGFLFLYVSYLNLVPSVIGFLFYLA